MLWICRFKEGLTREEAARYWEQVHGPIFKELEIDRYVQNHVVGPIEEGRNRQARSASTASPSAGSATRRSS